MRKVIVLFFIQLSIYYYPQSEYKNSFKLNAGVEYRITPYNLKTKDVIYPLEYYYNTNRDAHLSGTSLNFELEYFFFKDTSIGLMQNFRYDELYSDLTLNGNVLESSDMRMRLISDTGVFVKHYLHLKNENNAIFGLLGYAFMNNNTSFNSKRIYEHDQNEYPVFSNGDVNFRFQSIYLGIGYKYKKFEIMLGNHFVGKNSDPFDNWDSEGFGMPFIRLGYNIYNF